MYEFIPVSKQVPNCKPTVLRESRNIVELSWSIQSDIMSFLCIQIKWDTHTIRQSAYWLKITILKEWEVMDSHLWDLKPLNLSHYRVVTLWQ